MFLCSHRAPARTSVRYWAVPACRSPSQSLWEDGIATVTVHITVVYGSKVMPLCEKVQENVKQAIQNMTGITVARVDVLVVGLTDADKTEK